MTSEWPPQRLAEDTGFRSYRLCCAAVLTSAGYELWPTEVFVDDTPDQRNEVHYDLIVTAERELFPADLVADDKAARRAARAMPGASLPGGPGNQGNPVSIE